MTVAINNGRRDGFCCFLSPRSKKEEGSSQWEITTNMVYSLAAIWFPLHASVLFGLEKPSFAAHETYSKIALGLSTVRIIPISLQIFQLVSRPKSPKAHLAMESVMFICTLGVTILTGISNPSSFRQFSVVSLAAYTTFEFFRVGYAAHSLYSEQDSI